MGPMNGQWGALSWATHELPMMGSMEPSNKLPRGAHMFTSTNVQFGPAWGLCTFATTQLAKFHGPHERPLCVYLKTPTSKVIARVTPIRVQWILQVNCIHATQKSHETSQLWDQENSQETGVRICDKVIPTHMCLYCNLCIGIICGSHWSTHKTAHVKLLSYHTLVLYWAHSLRPMKQPMESHRFATHWHYMGFTFVGPWNCPT